MRNMKKIVSLTLAVALLLSSMTVAFAAVSTDAQICGTLGIIQGTGDGVTEEYTSKLVDRKTTALLELRLMGVETDATSFVDYTEDTTFTDGIGVGSWSGWDNLVAFLYADTDGEMYGWQGYTDGSIRPNDKMTFQAFAKVLLVSMGYEYGVDFTWSETVDFAADLGITDSTQADGSFTIDSLCETLVDAFMAETADGDSFVEALIEDGVVAEADAIEAGLVEEATDLEAVSATADSYSEIVITFNQDVEDGDDVEDAAETEGYYTVEDADDNVLDIMSATADGSTVTLLMTQSGVAVAAQDDLTITITDDITAEETELTISNVFDSTFPTVESIVTSGPDEFKITFSEPLAVEPSVEINNNAIYAGNTDWEIGDSTYTVEAGTSLTGGDSYTIEVADAEDYAGLEMETYTESVVYEEVEGTLTVEVTDVTEYMVTVVFSEDIDLTEVDLEDENLDMFWHSFSSYDPITVTAVDADEFDIVFADSTQGHLIPYTATTFTVQAEDDDDNAITDVWGNEMADDYTVTIMSDEDATAPTVTITDVNEGDLDITFSEEVSGATTTSNYTIEDADGDEYDIASVALTGDEDYEYIITFDEDLDGGEYTLEINDITDVSLNENSIDPDPTTLTFTVTDETEPDLTEVTAVKSGVIIYITFPEAMDDTAIDTDNYRAISGSALTDDQITPDSAEFFGSDMTDVKLTFDDDASIYVAADALIIGKVADAAGNEVSEISTSVTVTAADTIAIDSVETIDEDTMMITIDGEVTEGIDVDAIYITEGAITGNAVSIDSVEINDDDETEITFSLPWNITIGAAEVTFSVSLSGMETEEGFEVTTAAFTSIDDGIAPTYDDYTTAAAAGVTTVAITFDEPLDASVATSAAHDLIITVDGDELEAITDYTTAIASDTLTITLLNDDPADVDVTIDLADDAAYITDTSGNDVNEFDTIEIDTF